MDKLCGQETKGEGAELRRMSNLLRNKSVRLSQSHMLW